MVGLAGCASSGETNNAGAAASGETASSSAGSSVQGTAIESAEVDGNSLSISLADDAEVTAVRLVNPDGSSFGSAEVGGGVTTTSLELVSGSGGYTAGESTLVALNGEEVVEEMPISLRPELQITGIEGSVNGYAKVTFENVGTGPAWITGGEITGGQQEGGEYASYSVSGGKQDGQEFMLSPGESQTYFSPGYPFRYSPKGDEYEEYCTGEGNFAHELTVVVEDQVSGELSGNVSVALSGDKHEEAWNVYTCTTVEADGLPVTLSSTE